MAAIRLLKAAGWTRKKQLRGLDVEQSLYHPLCLVANFKDQVYWLDSRLDKAHKEMTCAMLLAMVKAAVPPRIKLQALHFWEPSRGTIKTRCYCELIDYPCQVFRTDLEMSIDAFELAVEPGMVLTLTFVERAIDIMMETPPGPGAAQWHTLQIGDRVKVVKADTEMQKVLKKANMQFWLTGFGPIGDLALLRADGGIMYYLQLESLGKA